MAVYFTGSHHDWLQGDTGTLPQSIRTSKVPPLEVSIRGGGEDDQASCRSVWTRSSRSAPASVWTRAPRDGGGGERSRTASSSDLARTLATGVGTAGRGSESEHEGDF